MNRALATLLICGTLLLGLWCVPRVEAGQSRLEKILPTSSCSLLHGHRLHGKKLWRHWVWHLRRAEYGRICATIQEESQWQPRVANPSGATGLVQFMPDWYNGVWWPYHFDPTDPVVSLRVMAYILDHPTRYGGWSNWAGH